MGSINPIAGNTEALNQNLPPDMPKSSNTRLIVLFSALILIFSGATGFLYYQNQQLKSMLATYQAPSPTPTATPDPTANWKTYTDTKYNFTFKYPNNIREVEGGVSGPTNGSPKHLASFSDPTTVMEGTDAAFDGFSVYIASINNKTFEEYIRKEKSDRENRDVVNWDATGSSIRSMYQYSEKSWVALNGPAFPNITVYYLALPDGKNIISFARSNKTKEFLVVFNQVLSTFTFLDTTPTCRPRPACLDATPRCLIPETEDMCPPKEKIACTLEARLCPDGSSVGRTGPNCEFAPCPTY